MAGCQIPLLDTCTKRVYENPIPCSHDSNVNHPSLCSATLCSVCTESRSCDPCVRRGHSDISFHSQLSVTNHQKTSPFQDLKHAGMVTGGSSTDVGRIFLCQHKPRSSVDLISTPSPRCTRPHIEIPDQRRKHCGIVEYVLGELMTLLKDNFGGNP